ncbi:superoxide dismutase [Pyrus ussuriensis x Pyrus communis]|uniref:Superoxide dismutase n=1 Tax=Pyrus ussuriensis x Pyrus communis TaxID=2448454 RepID=A0A5N5GIQ4_9ROSA|nr:superoxide dismutase [Pyrus ussuriensis x Pyrus communis]
MALRALVASKALRLGLQSEPRILAHSRGLQTFSLPDLPYDFGALEPAISGEIMQIHHQKHHQAYVTNYNKALEQLHDAISKGDAAAVVKLQSAIKFNRRSHGGGEPPHGNLGWAIDTNFGTFEALVQKISVWLALDKEFNKLVVETTANQDPLVTKGASLVPLLGIDVWEHAYYLQYKNLEHSRPQYLAKRWKTQEKGASGGKTKTFDGHSESDLQTLAAHQASSSCPSNSCLQARASFYFHASAA